MQCGLVLEVVSNFLFSKMRLVDHAASNHSGYNITDMSFLLYCLKCLSNYRFSCMVAILKKFNLIRTLLKEELCMQTCGPLIRGLGNGIRCMLSPDLKLYSSYIGFHSSHPLCLFLNSKLSKRQKGPSELHCMRLRLSVFNIYPMII